MEELINDKRFLDNLRLISNNLNIEFDDAVKEARIYLEEMYTDQHPIVRSIGVRLA
ncbi:MAG: hypothetical protein HKN99_06955, partial [Winogradskyella sp.]|nr:hypothetical protein [Winogradskyella sp.]